MANIADRAARFKATAAYVRSMYQNSASRRLVYNVMSARREARQVNYVFALDSLSQGAGGTSPVDFFRPRVQNRLGDGGIGFVAYNTSHVAFEQMPFGAGGASQKNNTTFDAATYKFDPNLYHLDYTAAVNAIMTLEDKFHIFDSAKCFYVKKPLGGTFNWRDAAAPTVGVVSVDTAAAVESLGIAVRNGFTPQLWNKVQAVVNGDVRLIGADLQRGTTGARVHRVAQGGSQLAQVAQLDGPSYTAFLQSIGCDCYVLNAGMNDAPSGLASAYDTNIRKVLGWVRSANPNAAIVLMQMNYTADSTKNAKLEEYRRILLNIADDMDCMVHDNQAVIDNYVRANAAGLMVDTTHPNSIANEMIGDSLFQMLGGDFMDRFDMILKQKI